MRADHLRARSDFARPERLPMGELEASVMEVLWDRGSWLARLPPADRAQLRRLSRGLAVD